METLVVGHKSPDTDSIAAAMGYAWVAGLARPEEETFVACRAGDINPETRWLLDRVGLQAPGLIEHVRMTARDAMKTGVVAAAPETPMHRIGDMMIRHDVRAIPILQDDVLVGIVGERDLARRYLDESEICGFAGSSTTVGVLAESIGARVIAGDPGSVISGRVLIGAMEPETMRAYVGPGDVMIIGDRTRGQLAAIERGAACLVISGGAEPDAEVSRAAAAGGVAILGTQDDTYGAARRVNLAVPARVVMDPRPLVVGPDDLLADVRADLVGSPQREAVVCDASGRLLGLVTRTDLARAGRRRVVLVDHSETAQSPEGTAEADIVAIIDHHRLGDAETTDPIEVITKPVGSTSTIVAEIASSAGLEPSAAMAGLLLGAILSDTLILRSPTTTDPDRRMAAWLAGLAGLESEVFGLEMFRARISEGDLDADETVRADLKVFTFFGHRVAIAQVETVDGDQLLAHREALLDALQRLLTDRELELAILMITDIVREGSVLLSRGRTRVVERAFGLEEDPERFLAEVLSRKKQVAAALARALEGA